MQGINIIQKQILQVDINLPGVSAFEIQSQVTTWCHEFLVPAINRKLENYSLINDVIRLDQVIIDMGEYSDLLTASFAEKIAVEIEIAIKNKSGEPANISNRFIVPKEKTTIEAFIFFLQHGYLPWWSNIRSVSELNENNLVELSENEMIVLKELLSDHDVRKRLVTSSSSGIIAKILAFVTKKEIKEIVMWFEKIRTLSSMIENNDLRFQFLTWSKQAYVHSLLFYANYLALIQTLVRQLMEHYNIHVDKIRSTIKQHDILDHKESANIFAMIRKDGSVQELFSENEFELTRTKPYKQKEEKNLHKEGIYINNAGLVLVAPFLPRFFENLGIVEEGRFNSKDLALALLQWLVKGKNGYEESELVLPKILCGMEPEEAVIIIPSLPESFKKESDNLLQSVIDHWNILKNTSVNGLRESFLQRDGKLSTYIDQWRLQVEQKPYDMLLEQLPWNISMTRLSWMKYLLKTEWVG